MNRVAIAVAIATAVLSLIALLPEITLPSTLHEVARNLNTTTIAWDFIFPVTAMFVLFRYTLYYLQLLMVLYIVILMIKNIKSFGGGDA